MHAYTIAQLAWYKPLSAEELQEVDAMAETSSIPRNALESIVHYAHCHKNLQFGWDFAMSMADNEIADFPAILHGDDLYIWRAYKYLTSDAEDPAISGAYSLTLKTNDTLRGHINALLVCDGITIKYIADTTGLPHDVIAAYEKLFFNVLDRKKDHAYIASIVYPNGRLVEAMEDYIENTNSADIILRAGFAHGAKHVLYSLGINSTNPYYKNSVTEGAEQLDKLFMSDGILYATLGWANQRRNARPILNARASMIAGKMGKGEDTAISNCVTPSESIADDLARMAQLKLQIRQRTEVLNNSN